MKEAGNAEEGREFQRREVEGKKPSLNQLILALREFHTIVVANDAAVWNVAEPLEVEYRQPIHQSSDQSNSGRKEIEKPPCGKETEGQEWRSRKDHQSSR